MGLDKIFLGVLTGLVRGKDDLASLDTPISESRYGHPAWMEALDRCDGQVAAEDFEPEGQVDSMGGEVAAGDEVQDGFLELRGKLGEGVAGAGAADGFELVQGEAVVECDGGRRGEAGRRAGGTGVLAHGEVAGGGTEEEGEDGVKGRELGGVEASGIAVDGALERAEDKWSCRAV
jgi:hypothetical protein